MGKQTSPWAAPRPISWRCFSLNVKALQQQVKGPGNEGLHPHLENAQNQAFLFSKKWEGDVSSFQISGLNIGFLRRRSKGGLCWELVKTGPHCWLKLSGSQPHRGGRHTRSQDTGTAEQLSPLETPWNL